MDIITCGLSVIGVAIVILRSFIKVFSFQEVEMYIYIQITLRKLHLPNNTDDQTNAFK